jgi:hypothetical protein
MARVPGAQDNADKAACAQKTAPSPGGKTTGGLDRVLNDDLRFRIFSLLSVAELHRVSVNHKFLRIFRDPQLWKTRVETLLPMLAPNARRAVERCLSGGAYIWCQQLQYDYDWQTRLRLLSDAASGALQLKRYMCDHVYERIYRDMARLEMVSMRVNRPGRSILITIPFVQTICSTKTGEHLRVFKIDYVDAGDFLACCTWKDALYHICVNGKKMESHCLLRVGDTLQMVRKKSGKVREFEMKLAMDSDIGFVERVDLQ